MLLLEGRKVEDMAIFFSSVSFIFWALPVRERLADWHEFNRIHQAFFHILFSKKSHILEKSYLILRGIIIKHYKNA